MTHACRGRPGAALQTSNNRPSELIATDSTGGRCGGTGTDARNAWRASSADSRPSSWTKRWNDGIRSPQTESTSAAGIGSGTSAIDRVHAVSPSASRTVIRTRGGASRRSVATTCSIGCVNHAPSPGRARAHRRVLAVSPRPYLVPRTQSLIDPISRGEVMRRTALIAIAFALAGIPRASVAQERIGSFVLVQQRDPVTDRNRTYAYTTAVDAGYLETAILVWRCDGDQLELFVKAAEYLDDDDVIVQWRFDSQPPSDRRLWNP